MGLSPETRFGFGYTVRLQAVCLDDRESISYIRMSRLERKRIGCRDDRKGREKERRL